MGLFSKKPQVPDYDQNDCEAKKKRMREIFNGAVEDGDSYEILYGYMSQSKFESGWIFDTNTTSFYFYIIGYRRSDFDIVLIQIDQELNEYTEACHIEMGKVANVSYNPKYHQLCLKYEKGYGEYGELLNLGDTSRKTMYGPKNIQQTEERERFLDFAEAFRGTLEQKGFKLDKWKR
ncbi:MAG: hypothetical protein HFI04_09480 [Lachnospiraceae bacterium]|jgi:hypothetical protein|nr:hypothetical protein [Lachnospiraceae bacterium]